MVLADGADLDAADALTRMSLLIAIARNESSLDSMQINALQDEAPADLIDSVLRLHASRLRNGGTPSTLPSSPRPRKVGRNEPCGCGSGKKSKRCCG